MLHYCPELILLFITSVSSSVIVVGAGSSGIAAAATLLKNDIQDITILEAEDRIGGRIFSLQFGEAMVDLGAEFCHGEVGNVVYEAVKDLQVLEPVTHQFDFYYSSGSKINKELSDEIQAFTSRFIHHNGNKSGESVGEHYLRRYQEDVLAKYRSNPDKIQLLQEGVTYGRSMVEISKGPFSWFDLASETHYKETGGNHPFTWKGLGHKTLLQAIMREFPNPDYKLGVKEKIIFNKTVTKITWNNEDGVTIKCSDQTTYTANHIIYTPSVGVLKATHKQVFQPRLPGIKEKAIDDMGFDCGLKIIMHFPTAWWKNNNQNFFFVWNDFHLSNSSVEFPDGPQKYGLSWITQVRVLMTSTHNPKVRIAWMTGELVKKVEVMPLATLKKGMMYLLRRFLANNYDMVEFDDITRSTWCSNSNFLGTYSFERVDRYRRDISNQAILAEPLKVDGRPRVLFAGEATSLLHFGTVHGAVESGYREAERLIELYNKDV